MRTRILPALVLLPLLAACAEVVATPPAEERAPAPAAIPVPPPSPVVAVDELEPATPPSAAAFGGPPRVQAVLGAPPPAAEEPAAEEPAAELASVEEEVAPPAPAGRLGTTIASLGSPTEPGLWLRTPLVSEPTSGRIEYNGRSVTVQLRPSGGEPGSGSQISVEAMRAVGATLTSLPELVVFSG